MSTVPPRGGDHGHLGLALDYGGCWRQLMGSVASYSLCLRRRLMGSVAACSMIPLPPDPMIEVNRSLSQRTGGARWGEEGDSEDDFG